MSLVKVPIHLDLRHPCPIVPVCPFEIEVRKSGWVEKILDRGFRKKDPSDSTKRVPIKNDDGTWPTEPVLLDGSGAVLADPSPTNAASVDADLYPTFDFTNIPSITAA